MRTRDAHWAALAACIWGGGCGRVFPDPATGQGIQDFYPLFCLSLAALAFGAWARRKL
jgi:hypothetical protein